MTFCNVFQVSREKGRIKLQATVVPAQEGLTVTIYGGQKQHVGAVAVAVPRPSLADPLKTSATASVITLVGHKDDELAKPAAERLAKELKQPVVVVAGVHLEKPTQPEIEEVGRLTDELLAQILLQLKPVE